MPNPNPNPNPNNPIIKLDLTVAPMGTPTPSLGRYIAAARAVLAQFPQIEAHLNPMSTTLRGPWDEVMAAVKAMHAAPFELGIERVITTIRLDDRRDIETGPIAAKMQTYDQEGF